MRLAPPLLALCVLAVLPSLSRANSLPRAAPRHSMAG
jgi:hypothetical protein